MFSSTLRSSKEIKTVFNLFICCKQRKLQLSLWAFRLYMNNCIIYVYYFCYQIFFIVFFPIFFSRIFGFVARKLASNADNQCHLFVELEPEQPATAITSYVNRILTSSGVKPNIVWKEAKRSRVRKRGSYKFNLTNVKPEERRYFWIKRINW